MQGNLHYPPASLAVFLFEASINFFQKLFIVLCNGNIVSVAGKLVSVDA
jgi:hypothetical protein